MRVLITGANGFIGKNLIADLREKSNIEILRFIRSDSIDTLASLVSQADFIFHLAGVNRPQDPQEFKSGNTDLTIELCKAVVSSGRSIPIVYTSSTQAELENPYGISKRNAEEAILQLASSHNSPVYLYRLPNIFGKWAVPDYNSAVATFCHNISRDLPIHVNDPDAVINLVYIDDLIGSFVQIIEGKRFGHSYIEVTPQYKITVGELASQLVRFRDSRKTLITESVGTGLVRALYSTYLSYLPTTRFTYELPKYGDQRGVFVEMLKTKESGQFSFFTAHPGVTRGGHYHHSKTEKFLVVKGKACFRFRHIVTEEFYELFTDSELPVVIETIPGWAHDITNVGSEEMIVLLWANEIFDRKKPDTYTKFLDSEA